MKFKKILLLILFFVTLIDSAALFDENGVEWTGTKALVEGNYQLALSQLLFDTLYSDTAYYNFKLGRAYLGIEMLSEALSAFQKAALLSEELSPFAYEQMAEIAIKLKRYGGGIQSLRVAVEKTTIMPYRFKLYGKMYSISKKYSDSVGEISWLEEIVKEESIIELEKKVNKLLQLSADKKYKELDKQFLASVNIDDKNSDLRALTNRNQFDLSAIKQFSTKTLYLFSRISSNCGKYDRASDWLHEALKRDDFKKEIPQKEYIEFRANLNYRLKNYSNALKWAKKYFKEFGKTSSMVYLISRSYRQLGKKTAATYWYDKHIKLFPYHKKTHDILWYRAWDMEDACKWSDARKFYKILYEKHKNRSKADDSNFRYALSYFREKKYKKAIVSFDRMIKKYYTSSLLSGAKYWKARSLFEINDTARSLNLCRKIIKNYPADYYAYRAKIFLEKNGDSSTIFCADSLYGDSATVQWLDSISNHSAQTFTAVDTARFTLGCYIAATGLIDDAELILEPYEVSFGKNLFVQYELSRLYKICGNANKSFRVIKKLTWRIPIKARECMPLPIYSLLYPGSFKNEILKGAEENGIEPELISSIIRQESMFNPTIKSPVGAVGLMQIMPYTGKEIAADIKDSLFTPGQLMDPKINIRYGSYYISKLLKQFDGDKVQAIAGYNGGPHNVKRWKSLHPDEEFDLFVEDIGYSETRKYVKRVLGNYWTYKKIGEFH